MTKEALAKLRLRYKERDAFKEFISLPAEQRRLATQFTPEQTNEIEGVIGSLPRITMQVSCYVDGTEGGDIYEFDALTTEIKIDLAREVKDDASEEAPFSAHSSCFPHLKQEILWLIIVNSNDHRQYQCIKINRKFTTCTKKVEAIAIKV